MAIGEETKLHLHKQIKKERLSYKLVSDFVERPVSELANSEHFLMYNIEKLAVAEGGESQGLRHLRQRQERAYHKAKAQPCLEVHLHHILSQKFGFSEEAKTRLDFLIDLNSGDATGENENFGEWLDYFLRWRIAHGIVAAIVEGPPADSNLTEAERRSAKLQPYILTYRADEIINFDRFVGGPHNGKFRMLTVIAQPRLEDSGKEISRRFRFRVADGENYIKETLEPGSGENWKVVDTSQGALPFVPMVLFGKGITQSWLLRTAELEKASFNLGSAKSNTIYQQCFRMNFVSGVKAGEMDKIGESAIIPLSNPDAKVFSLDEGDPKAAVEEEDQVSRSAFDLGMMRHNRVVDSKQVESAESKEKDLAVRERAYNRICDELERKVTQLLSYVAMIDGADETEAEDMTFSIPRDFGLTSFEHDSIRISQLQSSARETQNKELYDAILKTLVSRTHFSADFDGSSDEFKAMLFKAIETAQLPAQTFEQFNSNAADNE